MLDRLKQRWKVNELQLLLILITFAIGGSLTGYAGKKILNFLSIEKGWLWIVIYIIIICVLWPLAVLLISIPFGQYRFFIKYIKKIGVTMGIVRPEVRSQKSDFIHNIAIFASGAGTNAQKIIEYFEKHPSIKVSLIVCNKPGAGVLKIAEQAGVSTLIIEKERFFRGDAYIKELRDRQIDFIVLAGFLWKLPSALIKAYPSGIINIHPALLPKYGGKGLYGNFVHESVLANKEKESGISIHYVDEIYDHGEIVFQQSCPVFETDTVESLANRIHALEHEHYPRVIEEIVNLKS
jgi:formyltetrahydrofolate-dependent phosphoribosylglycinamide formyltransferase